MPVCPLPITEDAKAAHGDDEEMKAATDDAGGKCQSTTSPQPSLSRRPKQSPFFRGGARCTGARGALPKDCPTTRPEGASAKPCWLGVRCTRLCCWFHHPFGRIIDGTAGRRSRSLRTRKRCGRRKRRRSQHSRSRSANRSPKLRRSQRSQSCSAGHRRRRRRRRHRGRCPQRSPSRTDEKAPQGEVQEPQKDGRCGKENLLALTEQKLTVSEAKTLSSPLKSSFRKFVKTELGSDTSPEEALAEYTRSVNKRTLESVKDTELFKDLYHPLSVFRLYSLRVHAVRNIAQAFLQELQGQRGHEVPSKASVEALLVIGGSGLSAEVSIWPLLDAICRVPGFKSLALAPSPPPRPDVRSLKISREAQVRFVSEDQARAALHAVEALLAAAPTQSTSNAGVDSSAAVHLHVAAPTDAAPFKTQPTTDSASPEACAGQSANHSSIICRLDDIMGIGSEVTNEILKCGAEVQVGYLRRVHGLSSVEEEQGSGGEDGPLGEQLHPIDSVLVSKALKCVSVSGAILGDRDEQIQEKHTALCNEKTLQVKDTKFKCVECSKLFRGPDYVHKHLRKHHPELFQAIRVAAWDEAAYAAFIAGEPKWKPP